MHCLIEATKKQLALTGTIAGGKAEDLYYLIYRLAPWKMTSKGYRWTDVANFPSNTEKWSSAMNMRVLPQMRSLRRKYLPAAGVYRHQRQSREISPTIFTDFLLDCAVFLDLSDMSSYLPDLKGDGCDRSDGKRRGQGLFHPGVKD